MTYKELVDRIALICDQHPIIRDFGYGAISDLKTMNTEANNNLVTTTLEEDAMTLYPYVFLNPSQSTRTSQAISYRFNMIVMDTVLPNGLELIGSNPGDIDQKDPPYGQTLQVQSDCQQYIDDIIAALRFDVGNNASSVINPWLMDVQLSVNLTPFKERFADTVAGFTATLDVMIAQPINDCKTPF
jgi:hypothetical protein